MPISVVCPSCAARLRAPDKMAGRKTKCPKCSTILAVPALLEETAQDVSPEQFQELVSHTHPVETVPSSPSAPAPPGSEFDFDAGPRLGPRRSATAMVSNTVVIQNASGAAHSLGIASLVIGVLSFCVCWIPFLGLVVSALGLLLGLGGFILALQRGGSGIGFSIGGGALSALSLVICILWSAGLTSAFTAANNVVGDQGRTNQSPVSHSTGENGGSAKNEISPAPTKPEIKWFDASKGAVQQGNIRVRILSVSIGKVALKGLFGEDSWSEEEFLMVRLELVNTSTTKKIEYETWADTGFSFGRQFPALEDNFGNKYKRIRFAVGFRPVGSVESTESIYPNKSVSDILVFEAPVDTISYLRLELPAKNFGGTGMLRFEIPKSMIK